MANPQKENGFTAISNELMEAIAKRSIASGPRSVLDVITRNIYGYTKRKKVEMSISYLCNATGMSRGNISRAIRYLLTNNIICRVSGDATNSSTYSIQKDYDKWLVRSRVASLQQLASVPCERVASVPCVRVASLETLKKTKNKKQNARACASNINNNTPCGKPVENPSLQTELTELLKTLHPKNDFQIIKNILTSMSFKEHEIDEALGRKY